MGDFNAKVGEIHPTRGVHRTAPSVSGYEMNVAMQMLVVYASSKDSRINTFLQMKYNQKWTWRSLTEPVFNEIDSANINTSDVQIINKANVGSSHRTVRAMVQLNTRLARIRLVKSNVQLTDMD